MELARDRNEYSHDIHIKMGTAIHFDRDMQMNSPAFLAVLSVFVFGFVMGCKRLT